MTNSLPDHHQCMNCGEITNAIVCDLCIKELQRKATEKANANATK